MDGSLIVKLPQRSLSESNFLSLSESRSYLACANKSSKLVIPLKPEAVRGA